ncbi:hypothetical protein MNBD_GAMMA21-1486 [hydrothermal vent metagenome]|uniref:Calcineurin-like phosphoesterase domain-containing protein n=1 Tax=hydrothermal vent metagenome TaxID=652676 RepID=A0A3B1A727_9ZZZZ
MRHSTSLAIVGIFLVTMTGCSSLGQVRFSAIGDTPYYASDSELERLSETFDLMSTHGIPFVVHVGDIFRSWTPCSAELYKIRAAIFTKTPMPFLITLGDNEFNDCVDANKAQALFREIILGNPSTQQVVTGTNSAFAPIQVNRQKDMIENATWSVNNVDFIMLTLPDLPGNYPLGTDRINKILSANLTFMLDGFSNAIRNNRQSIVLIMHSDPTLCQVSGCNNFNNQLIEQVKKFKKPVLLINGSNHAREFLDGGYQALSNWSRLRPGNEPEELWPEITFSTINNRFVIKWHPGPSATLDK